MSRTKIKIDKWIITLITVNLVIFMGLYLYRSRSNDNDTNFELEYLAGGFIVPGSPPSVGLVNLVFGDKVQPRFFHDAFNQRILLPVEDKWTLFMISYGMPFINDFEILKSLQEVHKPELRGVWISIRTPNMDEPTVPERTEVSEVLIVNALDLELLPFLRGLCTCRLVLLTDPKGFVRLCLRYNLSRDAMEEVISRTIDRWHDH